ncbi:YVTN family beta-propeller protein [Actinoplanes octamycinicus]|uniref:YVTN family beta-propeller protein n=1 Tax=Actinoplanes octamycinicus TaxID=135948 RepID=A0A7W7M841_9ACTN|nr:YVTN family beta-propeller protein [Actinoplanes octamycinicus]GIE59754.1 hypothetical protein Aoc01nite_51560 [Actinoplanes octamycinicus]
MSGRRLAVVVTVEHHDDPVLRRYAVPSADVRSLAAVLGDPGLGGFEVEFLQDPETWDTYQRLQALCDGRSGADSLLIYFRGILLSGPAGGLYLATPDTVMQRPADTAVDVTRIDALMHRSQAGQIVIVLDGRTGGPVDAGAYFPAARAADARSRVVITAAARPEPPTFAGLLADGIRGGAADRDRDGYIGIDEIFDHLRERDPTARHWIYGSGRQPYIAKVRKPGSDQMAVIAELAAAAAGRDLPHAARSRATLSRMATGNDRVAAAASAALRRTSLRVAETSIAFGRVAPGTQQLTVRVPVTGPPLVATSTVTTSADDLHATLEGDQLRVSWFPTAGRLDGVVTVDGPAGSAQLTVTGEVSDTYAESAPATAFPAPGTTPHGGPGTVPQGAPAVPGQGGLPPHGVPAVPLQPAPAASGQGIPAAFPQGGPALSAEADSPAAPQSPQQAAQPVPAPPRVLPPPPPQWYNGNGTQPPVSGPPAPSGTASQPTSGPPHGQRPEQPTSGPPHGQRQAQPTSGPPHGQWPGQPTSGAPQGPWPGQPSLSAPVDPWPDAPTSSAPTSGASPQFHRPPSGAPVDPWAASADQRQAASGQPQGNPTGQHPEPPPGRAEPAPDQVSRPRYQASPTPYQVPPVTGQVSAPPGQLFHPPGQPFAPPGSSPVPAQRGYSGGPQPTADPDDQVTRPLGPGQTPPPSGVQGQAAPPHGVPGRSAASQGLPGQTASSHHDSAAEPATTPRGPWSGRPQRPATASSGWSDGATEELARPSGTWWAQSPDAGQQSGPAASTTAAAWPSTETPTQRQPEPGSAPAEPPGQRQPEPGSAPAEPPRQHQPEPSSAATETPGQHQPAPGNAATETPGQHQPAPSSAATETPGQHQSAPGGVPTGTPTRQASTTTGVTALPPTQPSGLWPDETSGAGSAPATADWSSAQSSTNDTAPTDETAAVEELSAAPRIVPWPGSYSAEAESSERREARDTDPRERPESRDGDEDEVQFSQPIGVRPYRPAEVGSDTPAQRGPLVDDQQAAADSGTWSAADPASGSSLGPETSGDAIPVAPDAADSTGHRLAPPVDGDQVAPSQPDQAASDPAAVTLPTDIWPGSPAEPATSTQSLGLWPSSPTVSATAASSPKAPTTDAEGLPRSPGTDAEGSLRVPGIGAEGSLRVPAADDHNSPAARATDDDNSPAAPATDGDSPPAARATDDDNSPGLLAAAAGIAAEPDERRPVDDQDAEALRASSGNSTQTWHVSADAESGAEARNESRAGVRPDAGSTRDRWDSVPMDSGSDTVAWQASPADDTEEQHIPSAPHVAEVSAARTLDGDDQSSDESRAATNGAASAAETDSTGRTGSSGSTGDSGGSGSSGGSERAGSGAAAGFAGGFVGSWLAAQSSEKTGSQDDRDTPDAAASAGHHPEPPADEPQPGAPDLATFPPAASQSAPVVATADGDPTGSWPANGSATAGAAPGGPAGPWPGDRVAHDDAIERTPPGTGWPVPAAASDAGDAGHAAQPDPAGPGGSWPADQSRNAPPRLPWEAGSAAAAAGGWPRPASEDRPADPAAGATQSRPGSGSPAWGGHPAPGQAQTPDRGQPGWPGDAGQRSAADETTVPGMAAAAGWPDADDPTRQQGPAIAPGHGAGFGGTAGPGADFGGVAGAVPNSGTASGGSIAGSPSGRVSWDGPDDWTRAGGLAGAPGVAGSPAAPGWQQGQAGQGGWQQGQAGQGGWQPGQAGQGGWQPGQGTNPAWPTSPAGWPNSPSWQQPGGATAPPNGAGSYPEGRPASRRHLRVAGVLLLAMVLAAGAYLGIRYVSGRNDEPVAQPTATAPQQQQPGGGQSAVPTPPTDPARKAPASLAVPVVVDTVKGVGREPEGVVVSPDNGTVYVADQGAKEVFFIGADDKKIASVAVPNTPRFLGLSKDGTKLYVSMFENDFSANGMAVIDTAKRSLIKSVKTGPRPFEPAVAADGRVWLPIHNGARVEIYDGTTLAKVQQISVPPNPHWVDFLPDGTRAFTSDHESSRMSVIDTRTGRVLNNITVGRSPHSVAVTPDGKTVLVTNYDVNTVESYDTTTLKLIKRYSVGKLPQAVMVSADGVHAYVVNEGSDTVSVLNLADKQITATIKVGDSPRVIAISPDGLRLYVTAGRDGAVTVLKAAEE